MPELTTYQSELFVGTRSEDAVVGSLDQSKLYQLITKDSGSSSPLREGMFVVGGGYAVNNDVYREISEEASFPAVSVSIDNELTTITFTNQSYGGQNVNLETGGNTLTGSLEFHVRDDNTFYESVLSKFYEDVAISQDGQTVAVNPIKTDLVFVLRILLNKDADTKKYLIAGITFTNLPTSLSFGDPAVQIRNLSWSQASGTLSHTVTKEA